MHKFFIGLSVISTLLHQNSLYSQDLTTINGSLIFPSDYLPAMTVCAVDIDSKQQYCIDTEEEQSQFSMKIPAGQYLFSAETDSFNKKAWMTTFNIDCGYPCRNNPIHVIKVEVEQVNNVNGICPCDWYTDDEKLIFPSVSSDLSHQLLILPRSSLRQL